MNLVDIGVTFNNVEDIKKLLECPVCLDIPLPPIYLCSRGHIVCNSCRSRTAKCPLCRAKFSKTRNFAAESIIEKCTLTCMFSESGCQATMDGEALWGHHKICCHRPFRCTENECLRKLIKAGDYIDHLETVHHINGTCSPASTISYSINFPALPRSGNHVWPPYYLKAFGQTFLFRVAWINRNVLAYVFGHGSRSDFESFGALIKISSPSGIMDSPFTWEGRILTSRDYPNSGILQNEKGFVMPMELIRNIAEGRQNVGFVIDGPSEWVYHVEILENRNITQAELEESNKKLKEAIGVWTGVQSYGIGLVQRSVLGHPPNWANPNRDTGPASYLQNQEDSNPFRMHDDRQYLRASRRLNS